MNLPKDISETSHSRFLMKRKNTSSTGNTKPVSTMPSGRTTPFIRSRTWS